VRAPHLRRGGEVVGERRVGLDGDDLVVLGPYLREEREQELASLGGLGLGVPEAREVFEDGLCAVEVGVLVTREGRPAGFFLPWGTPASPLLRRLDGLTPSRYRHGMARRKTTYYIDEGVLTATKMTAVATHRSESQLVEDALRAYVVDEGRGEAAREDLRRLLGELRGRPELNDLDDEQTMALAVSETRAARRERAAKRRGSAAG
jgi:hypothetical protein